MDLPGKDRAKLARIKQLFECFEKETKENVSSGECLMFLAVAEHPGLSLKEYCKLTGRPQSTVSRHLLNLGDRNRDKELGYQLVTYDKTPEDIRKNAYRLTAKGEQFLKGLLSHL